MKPGASVDAGRFTLITAIFLTEPKKKTYLILILSNKLSADKYEFYALRYTKYR